MSATMVPESRPPERNTPSGTSLIRWLCTAAAQRRASSSSCHSASLRAARRNGTWPRERPVARASRAARPGSAISTCPGGSCVTPAKIDAGPGDVAERQVVVQRLRVELRIEARRPGGTSPPSPRRADRPRSAHVERLDPDAVAPEHEAARLRVPEREREHAVELPRDVDALLLVEVGDHLDVGARA